MNRIIILAAIAVCCLSIVESHAQKVIKDASGAVYIDVTDMPTGSYSTTSLNKIALFEIDRESESNRVYKKLQIAKSDLGSKMTWAEAVGISTSYNATSAAGMTQGSSSGCATYREGGISGWRVPTQNELRLIYIMHDLLVDAGVTTLVNSNNYWSSMEGTIEQSWYVHINNNRDSGKMTYINKTVTYLVRCVREVN